MFARPCESTAMSKKSSSVRVPSAQLRPWSQTAPMWIVPEATATSHVGTAVLPFEVEAYSTCHTLLVLSLVPLLALPTLPRCTEPSVEAYHATPTCPLSPATIHGKTLLLAV